MHTQESLSLALKQLNSLPPIPRIAREILALRINTDEGELALLALIEQDPPLLSRIVGLANCPMFGLGRKIVRLRDAATVLGSKRVKMVALSFAMLSSVSPARSAGRLDIQHLWQHSLSVAMAMDTLARHMPSKLRPPEEEIYLAGLLHDIGFLALNYLAPELSDQFHARMAADPSRPVEELEAEMLETSHSELGAALARHWNLPESIVSVLKLHHAPGYERAGPEQVLVGLANLAERLLPTFGIAEPVQMDGIDEEWLALGIDPAQADEIKAKLEEHISKLSAIAA